VKGKLRAAMVVSVVVGVAQAQLRAHIWSHIASTNPIPYWVLKHGVRGDFFFALMFIQDVIINATLLLPVALVLRLLTPSRIWTYLAIACLAGFAWEYRDIFNQPALPPGVGLAFYVKGYAQGLLITIIAFVSAGAFIQVLSRTRSAPA
jgi:hypothetical protein